MVGLKFKVDTKKFAKDLKRVDQRMRFAGEGAEHALAVQMAKDTEQYVPSRTNSFSNRTIVQGPIIIYAGPFAGMLYNGKLMIDPNTGSAWARKGATKIVTGKNLNFSTAVHSKAQSHWFEASKAQNLPKWRNVAGRAMQREFRR